MFLVDVDRTTGPLFSWIFNRKSGENKRVLASTSSLKDLRRCMETAISISFMHLQKRMHKQRTLLSCVPSVSVKLDARCEVLV